MLESIYKNLAALEVVYDGLPAGEKKKIKWFKFNADQKIVIDNTIYVLQTFADITKVVRNFRLSCFRLCLFHSLPANRAIHGT